MLGEGSAAARRLTHSGFCVSRRPRRTMLDWRQARVHDAVSRAASLAHYSTPQSPTRDQPPVPRTATSRSFSRARQRFLVCCAWWARCAPACAWGGCRRRLGPARCTIGRFADMHCDIQRAAAHAQQDPPRRRATPPCRVQPPTSWHSSTPTWCRDGGGWRRCSAISVTPPSHWSRPDRGAAASRQPVARYEAVRSSLDLGLREAPVVPYGTVSYVPSAAIICPPLRGQGTGRV